MAAFDELQVIINPDQLSYQVDVAFASATSEIVINTTSKLIALKVTGNLTKDGATIKAVYSKLKDAWRVNTTLIKFPFPMGPITDEQFEMINGWNWDSTNTSGETQLTTELLRTGGWSVVDTGGNVNEYWSSCITLGTLGSTDQVYYQQLNSGDASVNFKLTGKVNQAVRIYYYDGTGTRPDIEALTDSEGVDGTSFVLRRYLKVFVREWQKIYAQSEIGDIGVSQLTYQAYRFPLTNSTDLKVTHTEDFVSLGAVITSIQGNGTTVTCNTATSHGLVTGDFVDISGTTTYDGSFQVTVTDSDTFTFLSVGTDSVTTGYARKAVYGNITVTYLRDSNGDIYSVVGTWVSGSNYVVGQVVQSPTNLQWYKCTTAVTNSIVEPEDDTGNTNWTLYEGQRLIGTSYYAFTTIIDADTSVAATASGAARTTEVYEQIQYFLRQNSDIDTSTGTVTGKTATALLRFVGDTLVTSNGVFIDSYNTQDTNAIEFYDYNGSSRTFPYVAALTVNFGTNLQNDQYAKYWVFFTTATVGNYGTSNAVLVQDKDGVVMGEELSREHRVNPDWVVEGTPVKRTYATHSYNYDSNDQRGGGTYNSGDGVGDTAKTDAPITIVGIGLNTGQFVTATGTIARSTANSVTLTASLERNYSKGVTYP